LDQVQLQPFPSWSKPFPFVLQGPLVRPLEAIRHRSKAAVGWETFFDPVVVILKANPTSALPPLTGLLALDHGARRRDCPC